MSPETGLKSISFLNYFLLTLFIVLGHAHAKGFCVSEECTLSAAYLLRAMDQSVDPCQDFYRYACGGWMKSNPLPRGTDKIEAVLMTETANNLLKFLIPQLEDETEDHSRPIEMLKKFYRSCAAVTYHPKEVWRSLLEDIEQWGGMPMLQTDTKIACDRENFTNLLAFTYKLTNKNLMPLFNINIMQNIASRNDSSVKIAIGLPDAFRTVPGLSSIDISSTTAKTVHALSKANGRKLNQTQLEIDIMEVAMLNDMINAHAPIKTTSGAQIKKIKDIRLFMPWVDLKLYFIQMADSNDMRNYINDDTEVLVSMEVMRYMRHMGLLLFSTNCATKINYIWWRVITTLLVDAKMGACQLTSKSERSKVCLGNVIDNLAVVAGALYVRENFQKGGEIEAREMVSSIQETMVNLLKENNWLQNNTKQEAMLKAKSIRAKVAFPEVSIDEEQLEIYYDQLFFPENYNYYDLVKAVMNFDVRLSFENLFTEKYSEIWTVSAAKTNDFYARKRNDITIPAASMIPPFYRINGPKALNYGGLGFIIGKEITHGFDNHGMHFDKDGNIFDWWDPQDKMEFNTKSQCFNDLYTNYPLPYNNLTLNGALTLEENIADNGGIKIAYMAYQNSIQKRGNTDPGLPGLMHLSNEKLFFLSFAQLWCENKNEKGLRAMMAESHTPPEFRVTIPMSNSHYFSEAFQCKVGTKMNPKHKCEVW